MVDEKQVPIIVREIIDQLDNGRLFGYVDGIARYLELLPSELEDIVRSAIAQYDISVIDSNKSD
jgi:hypothetical protein